MKSTDNFSITLPVTILREGKKFIAFTPALDLSTSGKTFDEAKKNFDEAVSLFIQECSEKGTLDSALHDLGWKKVKARWEPPKVIAQTSEKVRVGFQI